MKKYIFLSLIIIVLYSGCNILNETSDQQEEIHNDNETLSKEFLSSDIEFEGIPEEFIDPSEVEKTPFFESDSVSEEPIDDIVTYDDDPMVPVESNNGNNKYCSDWLNICFSLPEGYYVFDRYNTKFPEYSYLTITDINDWESLGQGDAFLQYATISIDYYHGDLDTLKKETDNGYYYEFETIGRGEYVVLGDFEFYKILMRGYGDSHYDVYFFERGDDLYEFKAGYNEEDIMTDLLETLEFVD